MRHDKPNSQDINAVWGESATGENLQRPSDSYIHDGWLQVKPPYQIENWSMNKLHSFVAYLNQRGIPEWDSSTEYFINNSYVMGSDGRVYKCIQTNIGMNPTTNGNGQYWELTSWDRYATTSKAGIARKATPEQVLAGRDNETYVTPATYKSSLPDIPTPPNATESNRGMIEIATQNEVNQGRDKERAITPSTLKTYADTQIVTMAAPTGSVICYTGTTPPAGYLECNGREYLRSEYSALFTVIGTRFGNGNGTTSFNVPDLRGEFVRGWDNGRGVDPDRNRTLGSHQGDTFRSHRHTGTTASDGSHSHDASTSSAGNHSHSGSTSTNGQHGHGASTSYEGNHSHSGSTNTTGNHSHSYRSSKARDSGGGDRGIVGWGQGTSYTYSASGAIHDAGNHSHSISTNTTGGHRHDIYISEAGNHNHSFSTNTTGSHSHTVSVTAAGSHSHSFTTNTEDSGGGSETRPRNTALMYIIKA